MFAQLTTGLLLAAGLLLIVPPSLRAGLVSENFLLSPEDQDDGELGLARQNILQDLKTIKSRIRILKKRTKPLGQFGGKIRILKMTDPLDYND